MIHSRLKKGKREKKEKKKVSARIELSSIYPKRSKRKFSTTPRRLHSRQAGFIPPSGAATNTATETSLTKVAQIIIYTFIFWEPIIDFVDAILL